MIEEPTDLRELKRRLDKFKEEVLKEFEDKFSKEKPKFNEPWKPKLNEEYFFINSSGEIDHSEWENWTCEIDRLTFGNMFSTEEEAEKRAKEIKLYNLLKNFSDANGGGEIEWLNLDQDKFFIYYGYMSNTFKVHRKDIMLCQDIGTVYFISEKVAAEAIRRYEKELSEVYCE